MSGKPVRKTQAIAPFGPGAIVDFPGPISLIHVGLDAYPFEPSNPDHEEFVISDEARLSRRLHVGYFVEPMEYRAPRRGIKQRNSGITLPFLRFPLWHQCPRCGILHKSEYHRRDAPKCRGPIGTGADKGGEHPERVCIQVRFITVCESGHISDFPWCEWIVPEGHEPFKPVIGKRWLRMNASGSASASGITVVAEELSGPKTISQVHGPKTLGMIFGGPTHPNEGEEGKRSPLGNMGISCCGDNPVLGLGTRNRPAEECGRQLWVVLKNASNLYYPSVVSSIFIPSLEDESLQPDILNATQNEQLCLHMFDQMRNSDDGLLTKQQATRSLQRYFKHLITDQNVEELQRAANTHLLRRFLDLDSTARSYLSQVEQLGPITVEHYKNVCDMLVWSIDPNLFLAKEELGTVHKPPQEFSSQFAQDQFEDEAYKFDEYEIFIRDVQSGRPKVDLDVSAKNIADYPDWFGEKFARISQLHKLRETRAFTGFSRIFSHGMTELEKRALFTTNRDQDWLPAVIVRGEGIFFEFSKDSLDAWYERNYAILEERESILTRGQADYLRISENSIGRLNAKKVMIHTFAHILINELIFDCGYGSASLRERLYCSSLTNPEMNAVLIYTAAGDTEGSMGGLVRQGEADRLPQLIESAVLRASWCSSDPVCIESTGQGPSGLNLAACHSCALLPETSCEMMNLQLDRAMLVGTPSNPDLGFFSDLLNS